MKHIKKHKYKPQEGAIVQPRDATEFKPLAAKNMFWLAPRREEIRTDASFKNGSSGYQVTGYRA